MDGEGIFNMKNMTLALVILLLVGGAVGAIFYNTQMAPEPESAMEKKEVMMEPEDVMIKEETLMEANEQYVFFSPEALAAASEKRRVLYFYANWCPTCQPADKDFQENATQLPEDVVVIRVNYNDDDTDEAEKALAKKYGVTYQHTYVQIDDQGEKVAVWNGGKLTEVLENIL